MQFGRSTVSAHLGYGRRMRPFVPLFALVLFAACTSDNSIVPVRAVSAHMTSQRPFTRLDGELLSAAQIDELIRRQVEIQSTQFPTLRRRRRTRIVR